MLRHPEAGASTPEHPNLAPMRQRHGWIIGTLRVWSNRARDRLRLQRLALRLQRLALQAPDSVFEDVGMSRGKAQRKARRWFRRRLLIRGRP